MDKPYIRYKNKYNFYSNGILSKKLKFLFIWCRWLKFQTAKNVKVNKVMSKAARIFILAAFCFFIIQFNLYRSFLNL